jgi:hypothetical protein
MIRTFRRTLKEFEIILGENKKECGGDAGKSDQVAEPMELKTRVIMLVGEN